jgi:hypothetical protein
MKPPLIARGGAVQPTADCRSAACPSCRSRRDTFQSARLCKRCPVLHSVRYSPTQGSGYNHSVEPKKKDERARFVRYFGPLPDALRALGGSGTPDEVVERIALDLGLSDEVQNELTPSWG